MTNKLTNYEVLLGVTGGIAAYKSAAICSRLTQLNAALTVVMTRNAQHFVGALTFSSLSGRRVYTDTFGEESGIYNTAHISLAQRSDLIVVAPATANIIAKMAAGICDDLLSTVLCSSESDILLAPAMNARMWENPATRHNVETLRQWGCHFVGPEKGHLACGEEGTGRMSEPEVIVQRIVELLTAKSPKA